MTRDVLKITAVYLGIVTVILLGAWSSTYDTSTPAGSDPPAVIDDRIREVKAGVQERENVDHYWPLTGTQVSDTDAGKHRRVLFYGPVGTYPTLETDEGFLGTMTVGGVSELCWKDENGNTKQLTNAGKLNVVSTEAVLPTGDQSIGGTKTFTGTVALNGAVTIGQNTDLGNYQLRAKQFYSDVDTGTAPFLVASTTRVNSLNADQVDGLSILKYDSGWFAVSANTTYTKAHGLGQTPTIVQVFYSDTSDGTGDVVVVTGSDNSYGTFCHESVCDLDATNVKVRAGTYVAAYVDSGGTTRTPTSGYAKVVALVIN